MFPNIIIRKFYTERMCTPTRTQTPVRTCVYLQLNNKLDKVSFLGAFLRFECPLLAKLAHFISSCSGENGK